MPCKLVEVGAHLAALGKQGGNSGQGFFSAACNDDHFLNLDVVDGAADKSGEGEICLLYTSVMPFRKFESVYDSDAYPEDVRYEYVALEELTTRFRISFNYQLEQMPDNAQRDVILEIIHKHKDYLTSLEAALADVKDQTA